MNASALASALSQPITAKLVLPPEPGAPPEEHIIRRVALPQCRFAGIMRVAARVAAEHGMESGPAGEGLGLLDTSLRRPITDDLSLLYSVQQACLESRSLRCAVVPISELRAAAPEESPAMPPAMVQRSSSLLMLTGGAPNDDSALADDGGYGGGRRPQTFPIAPAAAADFPPVSIMDAAAAVVDEPISTGGLHLEEPGAILSTGAAAAGSNNLVDQQQMQQRPPSVVAMTPAALAAQAMAREQAEAARHDEEALLRGSPFDVVCLKHIQRHLRQLNGWDLQQLEELHARETNLLQAFSEEAEAIHLQAPSGEAGDDSERTRRLWALEKQLRDQVEHARIRHRHQVHRLAQEYDRFLEGMSPDRFLRPLRLRISIVSLRDCSFEVEAHPGETFDGLRHLIMDRMDALGLPIGQFGANSSFVVFPQPADKGQQQSSFGNSLLSLFRGNKQQQQLTEGENSKSSSPFIPTPAELTRRQNRSGNSKPHMVREELTTRLRDVGVVDGTLIVLLGTVALRGEKLAQPQARSVSSFNATGAAASTPSPPAVSASPAYPAVKQQQRPQFNPAYVPGDWALSGSASRPQHQAQHQRAPANHAFFRRGNQENQPDQQRQLFRSPQDQEMDSDERKVNSADHIDPGSASLAFRGSDPTETYREQLLTLQDMGFSDPQDLTFLRQALMETGGNIAAAVERLLMQS